MATSMKLLGVILNKSLTQIRQSPFTATSRDRRDIIESLRRGGDVYHHRVRGRAACAVTMTGRTASTGSGQPDRPECTRCTHHDMRRRIGGDVRAQLIWYLHARMRSGALEGADCSILNAPTSTDSAQTTYPWFVAIWRCNVPLSL